jgi:hypothetical protein
MLRSGKADTNCAYCARPRTGWWAILGGLSRPTEETARMISQAGRTVVPTSPIGNTHDTGCLTRPSMMPDEGVAAADFRSGKPLEAATIERVLTPRVWLSLAPVDGALPAEHDGGRSEEKRLLQEGET